MKIGIISDTHDNLPKIKEAVDLLNERKVDLVVHAGDYVSPFSLAPLRELSCDWTGVFGNNDGDRAALDAKSSGRVKESPLFLELSSRKIALTHSYLPVEADIVICGHTHLPEIKKQGQSLIINPGEVCGWVSGRSSLLVLDLSRLTHELIYF